MQRIMPGSYQKISYNLRPAKSIERKMLCESFQRLSKFQEVNKYKYVGMGATFFLDFILFHKLLGITDMISIESDEFNQARFDFNRPYKCIDIKYGFSYDILPSLDWKNKIILWLDYDEKLKDYMLTDIGTFIKKAQSGSIIIITINAEADSLDASELKKGENFDESQINYRYESLIKRLNGNKKIPSTVTGEMLDNKNIYAVYKRIIDNEIADIISLRNQGEEHDFIYNQLYNFIYNDSCQMISFGGVIYKENESETFKECKFYELNFIRSDIEPWVIKVPKLTFSEMRALNKLFPANASKKVKADIIEIIEETDRFDYEKIYKYFPNFVEAEI